MDSQKFGAFVAALRKERGWTQQELADRLNVTAKAVSKWECGAGFPDVKTLEPLADALGVSLLELMRGVRISEQAVSTENAEKAMTDVLDVIGAQKKLEKLYLKKMWLSIAIFAVGILFIFASPVLGVKQADYLLRTFWGGSMDSGRFYVATSGCLSNFRTAGFAVCLFAIAFYLRGGKRN